MSIRNLSEDEILCQAEQGDLRPQWNPHSVVTWPLHQRKNGLFEPDAIRSRLATRFFELARPIADACQEPGLHMRLGDAGRFFYLIEALERVGYDGIEQTLLMFLDEFSQLELRSYDELYLWSIVELSRRKVEFIDAFWPMVLTLDLHYRSTKWKRPPQYTLDEWPYRLTELVMYYYVLYTQKRVPSGEYVTEVVHDQEWRRQLFRPAYPFLATCLRRILPQLSAEQAALLLDTLRELARQERRPAFGDAYGLMLKEMRKSTAPGA